jgi:SWIM zinc finger
VGPWARSLVSAVVGRTERLSDEELAEVRNLTAEVGTIRAEVGECVVTLTAERVPLRIWVAMTRFAQNRGQLKEAVEGRNQSVHLEHLMAEDWGEPLIPRASSITQACTCDGGNACEHIVAVTYAFADRIDANPAVLLRWRGCYEGAPPEDEIVAATPEVAAPLVDPWQGGRLPDPGAVRALPVGAVLKRLGPSAVHVGEEDLAVILRRAYAALAPTDADSR